MSWSFDVRVTLDRFELDVELSGAMQPVAIIGPNGSGKSTLLRVIAGALTPDRGELFVGPAPLFSSSRGVNLSPQERRVGYVPQGYGLFPHMTALDNVRFGVRDHAAAERMLNELDADALANRMPASLSGGEQQRVALARALVTDPQVLLLDEPLAALDVRARRETRTVLATVVNRVGCATLIVTHDLRDVVALNACVCVLDRGRVVQRGSVAELEAAPANPFVEEFVGLR